MEGHRPTKHNLYASQKQVERGGLSFLCHIKYKTLVSCPFLSLGKYGDKPKSQCHQAGFIARWGDKMLQPNDDSGLSGRFCQ